MARRFGGLLGLVALALASAACEPTPRRLVIDVQTDLVAQYELGLLDVEVIDGAVPSGSAGDVVRSLLVTPRIEEAESFRGGRRIGEITDLAPATYTVRVVARRPAAPGAPADGGAFLLERRTVLTLRDADRVVRVVLHAPCVDHVCPGAGDASTRTQCLNGECVEPTCDPSQPDASEACCSGSGCAASALCAASSDCVVASCALPSCIDGACIALERPGACGADEYCDRSAGACLPIPGGAPPDAGTPDAGLPDAGSVDAGSADAGPPDAGPPDAHAEDTRCPDEICGNGMDDDCDGQSDCTDADCAGSSCDDGDPCTHGDACTGAAMGPSCAGTAITCTSSTCMARSCNGTASCTETPRGGACEDDGNVCTTDVCSAGACTHPPVAGTVFCADDGNPCSFDLCDAGVCTHPRGFDGWSCGIFGRCCNNSCVDVSTDPTNCGVCGIRCPGTCSSGSCESGSTSACIAAGYGPIATSYMGRCQCRCNLVDSDRLTCTGQCAGGATCDQRAGLNACFYP